MSEARDSVIVLAAGRGVRAGGPKALHSVQGRAWWEIQRERLERVGLPVVWVVSPRVREGIGTADLRMVVADELAPMFASVLAGAREIALQSDRVRGVFVLPVDVPAPDRRVFEALARAVGSSGAAIPVHHGERGHPVYVSWDLVRGRVLGAGADARLDHLIEDGRMEVSVDDPGVLDNLNTAADFDVWASRSLRE